MVLAAVLFVVSAIGSGLAFCPWDLILWRVIGGLGVGAASVIAPAYIAEISPALDPRPAGLAAAAGHRHRHLRRAALRRLPRQRRRRGRQAAVVRAGRPGGGCSSPASSRPWPTACMSLQIPESPRYLVARGENDKARCGARAGPQDRASTSAMCRDPVAPWRWRRARPSRTCSKAGGRAAADRLGRDRPVGLPAVRRHQRDLLLLLGAVAAGRLQRERRADHHRHHLGDEHRGHPRRDLRHRQDRPPRSCC